MPVWIIKNDPDLDLKNCARSSVHLRVWGFTKTNQHITHSNLLLKLKKHLKSCFDKAGGVTVMGGTSLGAPELSHWISSKLTKSYQLQTGQIYFYYYYQGQGCGQ